MSRPIAPSRSVPPNQRRVARTERCRPEGALHKSAQVLYVLWSLAPANHMAQQYGPRRFGAFPHPSPKLEFQLAGGQNHPRPVCFGSSVFFGLGNLLPPPPSIHKFRFTDSEEDTERTRGLPPRAAVLFFGHGPVCWQRWPCAPRCCRSAVLPFRAAEPSCGLPMVRSSVRGHWNRKNRTVSGLVFR